MAFNEKPRSTIPWTICDCAQQQGCIAGRGGGGSSCCYRDFSGVQPSNAELMRYENNRIFIGKPQQNSEKKNSSPLAGGLFQNDVFKGDNFPSHLYDLLSVSSDDDAAESRRGGGGEGDDYKSPPAIITWLPHGRSWIIRDKKDFMLKKITPSHRFKVSKMRL